STLHSPRSTLLTVRHLHLRRLLSRRPHVHGHSIPSRHTPGSAADPRGSDAGDADRRPTMSRAAPVRLGTTRAACRDRVSGVDSEGPAAAAAVRRATARQGAARLPPRTPAPRGERPETEVIMPATATRRSAALREYRDKRNFRKTPEPAPGRARRHKEPIFV